MILHGWAYKGRKISDLLHQQFYDIVKYLTDPSFVAGRDWPVLQKEIAKELGVEAGQIRTIKTCMEQFCILKVGSLNNNKIPDMTIYTKDGLEFIDMLKLEYLTKHRAKTIDNEMLEKIHQFYQFYYIKFLSQPTDIGRNSHLNILRATLKAIKKYESLDYWEWYLLNTFITKQDDKEEENRLQDAIIKYRNHELFFTKEDIQDYQLSISYVLGNIEYTGLVLSEGAGLKHTVFLNKTRMEVIEEIIK